MFIHYKRIFYLCCASNNYILSFVLKAKVPERYSLWHSTRNTYECSGGHSEMAVTLKAY